MSILRTCLLAASVAFIGVTQMTYATDDNSALSAAVAARSDEEKSRDAHRHPTETLAFFRIEPGMTVAEGLPGGGWYTRILANYLGKDGTLYGVSYADRMWPMLRPDPEWIAARTAATHNFAAQVASLTDNGITAEGFTFETVPPEIEGTVDRVLLIRALHNLNRFEAKEGTRTKALAAVHAMLKDDGMVGVVQHRAPASLSAEWAEGNQGYLNEAAVIVAFESAGFELVAQSEINANPLDQPAAEDNVWRLPPSLRSGDDSDEHREAMQAIGESDRMTLLFRKAR